MNFLSALQKAFNGYGIRRRAWAADVTLYFNPEDNSLRYLNAITDGGVMISEAELWEPNEEAALAAFQSTDWEAI
jgi:hypothetical protein